MLMYRSVLGDILVQFFGYLLVDGLPGLGECRVHAGVTNFVKCICIGDWFSIEGGKAWGHLNAR